MKQDWSMRLLQKQDLFGQKKAMKKLVGIRENSYSLFHSSQSLWSKFEQRIKYY